MPPKKGTYTSDQVDGLIKDAMDSIAENYQKLLQQVRSEMEEKLKNTRTEAMIAVREVAAQRDFIWEQYNSLVNTLGANAIAVIFDEKEIQNG